MTIIGDSIYSTCTVYIVLQNITLYIYNTVHVCTCMHKQQGGKRWMEMYSNGNAGEVLGYIILNIIFCIYTFVNRYIYM